MRSAVSTRTTTTENKALEDAIEQSSRLNPLYVQNFRTAMEAVVPGAGDLVAGNIGSLLKGEIPKDVQDQIEQSLAESNLLQGRFGEAAGYRTARDIGKTSLELKEMGLKDLKMMTPELPDIASLMQANRQFDLQRDASDAQKRQFQQQLAEQKRQFNQQQAMTKLQMTLNQNKLDNETAERRYEFDKSLAWEKELSKFNMDFEKWSIQNQRAEAERIRADKQYVADRESKSQLDAMKMWTDALAGSSSSIVSTITKAPVVQPFVPAKPNPITPSNGKPGSVTYNGQNYTSDEFLSLVTKGFVPLSQADQDKISLDTKGFIPK